MPANYTSVTSPKNLAIFFAGRQQGKLLVLLRWFLFVWFMGDEISEHTTHICWGDACQQHTVQYIYNAFQWMGSKSKDN